MRPRSLDNLLSQISDQVGDRAVDLLVVDNDPEGSAEFVCRPFLYKHGWMYTREGRPGVSHVRNRILDAFREFHDALIMVDDDQELDNGWLDAYLAGVQKWPHQILSGSVQYVFPDSSPEDYVASWYSTKRAGAEGTEVSSTGAGNVALPWPVWEASGFPRFDPTFGLIGGEDTDFFKRITEQGWVIRRLRSAQVNELVPEQRATREFVRKRTIRQGEIRGAMAHIQGRSFQAVIGGVARVVVGAMQWLSPIGWGRSRCRKCESRILTGIGYIKGSIGTRSRVYGGVK